MKRITWMAMSALLLGACASSGTHQGMVYRDGSWYSPAEAGRGDYYTAMPRSHYDYGYDHPYYYGIGLVPYGAYCPVQYRWCTSYWPVYDPWYQPWAYYQHPRRHHYRDRHEDLAGPGFEDEDEDAPTPRTREPRERTRPDVGQARPTRTPRSARTGGEGRRRHGGMGSSGTSGGGNN